MPKAANHAVFARTERGSTRIWRYMDFTAFVAMLEYRGLYFPRADEFRDPYEGAISLATRDYRERLRRELHAERVRLPAAAFRDPEELHRRLRAAMYVSSWHMNEHESAAMWSQYGRQRGSIAIESTIERLARLAGRGVRIGSVQYIDHSSDLRPDINLLWRFMYKRKSFEHERELRAVIADFRTLRIKNGRRSAAPSVGAWRNLSLDRLITGVRVAPNSPPWLLELVRRVARSYGLHKTVRQSSMDDDPFE